MGLSPGHGKGAAILHTRNYFDKNYHYGLFKLLAAVLLRYCHFKRTQLLQRVLTILKSASGELPTI